MKEKEKRIIRLMVIAFLISSITVVFFYEWNTRLQEIQGDNVEVLKQTDKIKLKIKKIEKDHAGNICIQLLTKNDNITYEYHNWTLGDGSGPYKKVQIVIVQPDKILAGKTYPYKMQLSDEDMAEGYTEADGFQCYIRSKDISESDVVAVVYEDRDGKKYIVYQDE